MTFESNIELLLRSTRLVDLLAHYGKRVDHIKYMYYSPFREEAKPSMCIRQKDGMDIWVDYGASLTEEDKRAGRKFHGGGVIDMAMELGHLTKKEAVDLLTTLHPGLAMQMETASSMARPVRKTFESGIVIEKIFDSFTNKSLVNYAEKQRCIPVNVLSHYCRQIKYHTVSNSSRSYIKIGFPNNEGGWALRGTKTKISSGSGISTFNTAGELTATPSSDRAFIFEGFFDFLSWITWNGGVLPKVDACVLNSVTNLHRAEEWLKAHKEIAICFDNDQAGENATKELVSICKGAEIRDCSYIYKGFNDLNEFFVHRRVNKSKIVQDEQTEPPSKGLKI